METGDKEPSNPKLSSRAASKAIFQNNTVRLKMKKSFVLIGVLFLFFVVLIIIFIDKGEKPDICALGDNNQKGLSIIFVKGFDRKKGGGCKICSMKQENFSQWKRLNSLYGKRIKIIGYYSKEWEDVIGLCNINFKPMDSEMEKVYGNYSSFTLICKDGKLIYKHKGEIEMADYRRIRDILNQLNPGAGK